MMTMFLMMDNFMTIVVNSSFVSQYTFTFFKIIAIKNLLSQELQNHPQIALPPSQSFSFQIIFLQGFASYGHSIIETNGRCKRAVGG